MRNLFVPLSLLCLALGCRHLDPAGPYKGDTALFEAHRSILSAYDILHEFVKFEYDNRTSLNSRPEIRRAANAIRLGATKWLDTAGALVDAYEQSPSDSTRNNMTKAIDVLRQAMSEATAYMAEQKRKGVK